MKQEVSSMKANRNFAMLCGLDSVKTLVGQLLSRLIPLPELRVGGVRKGLGRDG